MVSDLAIMLLRRFRKRVHSGAAKPEVEKTRGQKVPRSTLMILSAYSRFFTCSWWIRSASMSRSTYDLASGWNTRTSKNASWALVQNPLARMSVRASGAVLVEAATNTSPERGASWGSTATAEQTSVSQSAIRSRTSLWRMVGKPPRGQHMAWVVVNGFPHPHVAGTS